MMTDLRRDARRLDIAWVRLYCATVPKPYRRTWLRHTMSWGLLGPLLWISTRPVWPVAEWLVQRLSARSAVGSAVGPSDRLSD
jgi:hypothetical protein